LASSEKNAKKESSRGFARRTEEGLKRTEEKVRGRLGKWKGFARRHGEHGGEGFGPFFIPAWMTESQPWRGKFKAAGTCPRFSAPVFSAIRNQPQ